MTENYNVKEQKALLGERINSNLRAMQVYLRAIWQIKEKYKTNLARLEKVKDLYKQEVYDQALTEIRQTVIDDVEVQRDAILDSLDSMLDLVIERHALLDLEDVKISNALKIIQSAGGKITLENIKKLITPFEGDQASLQILKQALEGVGAQPLQVVNDMVYEPVFAFHVTKDKVFGEMNPRQLGSINQAAKAIAKLAKYEGFEFDTFIDPYADIEALRKGAGLN